MLIASATFALKCHDLQTGEIVHNYAPNFAKNAYIKHFTWNKDGTWLAITPTDGTTFVLTIKNANIKLLHKVTNIQEPTCSVFMHDTKKYLSLGTSNGSVLTYDFKSESVIKKYPKVDSSIFAIYYCVNDTHLISGSTNGEIIVFNANTKVKSSRFRIPNSKTLSCVRPHQRKRHLLAGGSENGSVAVWDLNQSKLKYCNKFHKAPVKEITFLPNREDILFTIGMDKRMRFQDIKNNQMITEIDFDEVMTCMDVSYDATNMIIGTQNGNIHIYDVRNIKLPKLLIEKAHDSWVEKIAFQTCISPETTESFEEVAQTSKTLSVIAEESTTQIGLKLSATDSFIDEFGINESLNSPLFKNLRQKSASECSETDSFLDALGMNSPLQGLNKTTRSSLGPIAKKVESLLQEKPGILDHSSSKVSSPMHSLLLLERVKERSSSELIETPPKEDNLLMQGNLLKKELTSTPKPVVGTNADIRTIVKEVILEETNAIKQEIQHVVDAQINILKELKDLKIALKETAAEQTAILLESQQIHFWRLMEFHKQLEADKHMYRVKESIRIEESFVDLAKLITRERFEEDEGVVFTQPEY